MKVFVAVALSLSAVSAQNMEACDGLYLGTPPEDKAAVPTEEEYDAALKKLDLDAVKADIVRVLTVSRSCWPADFGNYGPFFVRLAWHCSGSYRKSDGKGGCAGGMQRFEPQRSWADNTNLDKARALLANVKAKYGDGLSWGDLFTLAGTTAMRSMGTPIKQWCAGRIDRPDGKDSLGLGPSPEQEKEAPCAVNGKCKSPLGSTTVGLIYLNPEGPVDDKGKPQPIPSLSAKDVRDSFDRMDHDDRDTVALIGGGHAFGKTHGACTDGPGNPPNIVYMNQSNGEVPWAGGCGTGKGRDAFTSGFEGPWTTKPLVWDNEFFKLLVNRTWEKHIGPGGHWQWRMQNPSTDAEKKLMRLTSDMSLLTDPKYLAIVNEFATDMKSFDAAFDKAWTTLITKGGQWSPQKKCDDSGAFPEHLLDHKGMKATDLVVV